MALPKPETQVLGTRSVTIPTTLLNFMPLLLFFFWKTFYGWKFSLFPSFVCTFSVISEVLFLFWRKEKRNDVTYLATMKTFFLLLLTGLDIVWSKIMGDTEAEIPKKIEVGNCATSRNSYFLHWYFDWKSWFMMVFSWVKRAKKSTIQLFKWKSQYRM